MTKIRFSNGKVVNFNGTPTQADIEEISASFSSQPTAPAQPDNSLTGSGVGSLPVIKQLTEVGSGIGTAIGKAGLNVGKAFLQGSQALSSKVLGTPKDIYNPFIQNIDTISNNLYQKPFEKELSTVSGKIGQGIGTVAPYVATGGAISNAANVASGLSKGAGILPAAGRVALGAGTEAMGNFGTGYALSGGDVKQAKTQALVAGTLKAGTAAIGETLNAFGFPEGLAGRIFKTDKKTEMAALKGSTEESLAKQVVDRGISGNTQQVAKQLTDGMAQSEARISQEFANAGNPKITLEEPQKFIAALQNKAEMLRKAGATTEAKGIEFSIKAIDPETGQITANNALSLRRFLDGLTYEKSFYTPTEELTAQQAGLKEMSNEIRHQINAIGGTNAAMKDYQFYIKAMDKLSAHAARTKNNDALGLINTFLLGESIANANPVLATAGIARKVLNTTTGATKVAQTIKNLPTSSVTGAGVRSAVGGSIAKNQ